MGLKADRQTMIEVESGAANRENELTGNLVIICLKSVHETERAPNVGEHRRGGDGEELSNHRVGQKGDGTGGKRKRTGLRVQARNAEDTGLESILKLPTSATKNYFQHPEYILRGGRILYS